MAELEAALADSRHEAEAAAAAVTKQLAAKQAETDDLAAELAAVRGQPTERVRSLSTPLYQCST